MFASSIIAPTARINVAPYVIGFNGGRFEIRRNEVVQVVEPEELLRGEIQTDLKRFVLEHFTWDDISSGELYEFWMCNDCEEFFCDADSEVNNVDDRLICDDCIGEYGVCCCRCDKFHHVDDLTYVGREDELVCSTCLENNYVRCDACDEYIRSSNSVCDDDRTLCNDCYDNHYCTCERCDRIIHVDDAFNHDGDTLCECCYEERSDGPGGHGIYDYNYVPRLNFKGEGNLHFGVELEIDNGDKYKFKFGELNDHFYCKHDGSLDYGFEIVSHPMTYEWMMENTPFHDVVANAKRAGFKSHNTTTCGLHVHMSRKAFGIGDDADNRITSFIYFFEKFWKEIVQFSRRDPRGSGILAYAMRFRSECDVDDKPLTISKMDAIKKEKRYERYQCVNLTNTNTIEVRIFRGTLNESTIIASIQLCKLFYELSVFDVNVLENMTWDEIKKYAVTDYPELIKAFEERKL
jgi:formylmethanofuran dehydrogenase subunit E